MNARSAETCLSPKKMFLKYHLSHGLRPADITISSETLVKPGMVNLWTGKPSAHITAANNTDKTKQAQTKQPQILTTNTCVLYAFTGNNDQLIPHQGSEASLP